MQTAECEKVEEENQNHVLAEYTYIDTNILAEILNKKLHKGKKTKATARNSYNKETTHARYF